MPLTLDYRPLKFADVVGQHHIKPVLRAMLQKNRIPPVLIFAGPRGTGKTTMARIIAAALNCEKLSVGWDACGECPSCKSVQQTNSTSVLEIDAASNGTVAEVRRIQELCQYGHGGEWRVVLWDEAHSMSKEAWNALLKITEEPPANTLFVLLTTEVNKIPATIASRSMPFDFRRLSLDDVVGRLSEVATKEGIEVDQVLFPAIAVRAEGGMRDALMTLDQLWVSKVTTIEGYRELFGIHDVAPALFNCALTGDYGGGTSLLQTVWSSTGDLDSVVVDLTMLTADLLVLKSGGTLPVMGEADKAIRQNLAQKVTVDKLLNTTKVLWQLRDRVKALGGDQVASATLGFFMISQVLYSGPVAISTSSQSVSIPPPAPDRAEVPVTLERLQELARR